MDCDVVRLGDDSVIVVSESLEVGAGRDGSRGRDNSRGREGSRGLDTSRGRSA